MKNENCSVQVSGSTRYSQLKREFLLLFSAELAVQSRQSVCPRLKGSARAAIAGGLLTAGRSYSPQFHRLGR